MTINLLFQKLNPKFSSFKDTPKKEIGFTNYNYVKAQETKMAKLDFNE